MITAYHPVAPWFMRSVAYLSSERESERWNVEGLAREAAQEVSARGLHIVRERHLQLKVTPRTILGSAVDILASAASRAGLLVVGSCGHGGFAGLLLGSVGQGVIHSSPCPVVVVHGGTPQPVKQPSPSMVPQTA
jgi:nucleotide-binding universal stress UspA family protein